MQAVVYVPLSRVRTRLPGSGTEHPHPATLVRWVTRGIEVPSGERIKLRAVRVGNRWMTTDRWFDDFVGAMTSAHQPDGDTPRTEAQRRRVSAQAQREVAEAIGA